MTEYILAIDQGGHASRALLFDSSGNLVIQACHEIKTHHPHPSQVEHNPSELMNSIFSSIDECVSEANRRSIKIVTAGLATQRSSIICWDKNTGIALSNVISWQDRRAASWLNQFKVNQKFIHDTTGLYLSPHYGVSKIDWCLKNIEPVRKAAKEGHLIISPLSSFIAFHLCTEHPIHVDPANASRTLLLNAKTKDWDNELINIFNLPNDILPIVSPSNFCYGTIKAQQPIPLSAVTGDQSATLFHNGAPKNKAAYINVGTGAFIQRIINEPSDDVAPLLSSIVYHDNEHSYYALEGTVNGAGSALSWFEESLNEAIEWQQNINNWLEHPSNTLFFINAVGGIASPYWLSQQKPRFIGQGNIREKFCAIVESILFLIYRNLQIMDTHISPANELIISGGFAVSDVLCQRLADLSQTRVVRPQEKESTARGLAFLISPTKPCWKSTNSYNFNAKADAPLRQRYREWCLHMDTLDDSLT